MAKPVGHSRREEETTQNKSCETTPKYLLVFSRILSSAYAQPGIKRLAHYGGM